MKKLLLLIAFCVFCTAGYAQQQTFSGKVVDVKNLPLPGVTIVLKESKTNYTTDEKGNYQFKANGSSLEATFTYIGYSSKSVLLKAGEISIVKLEDNAQALNEIVVVGYGAVAKKDLTGAVATISEQQLDNRHNTRITQALQGAAPGVTVTRSSTDPGAGGSIRIRGITTLGVNDPLVLIDGVPGNIDNVNPDDVANMSVLKDAASAAIYGSRAAAGVILITTKRAQSGQASVTYSTDYGIQKAATLPQFVDGPTYMRLNNQIQINDGRTPVYAQALIDDYLNLNASNPDKYPNTDWGNNYYRKTAPQQRHNLEFSLGQDKVKSKVLLGYNEQEGLEPNRSFNRFSIRANNDFNINRMLTANVDLAYARTEAKSPTAVDRSSARFIPPIFDDYYDDGRFAPARDGGNPIAQNELGGRSNSRNNQLSARLQLNFEPMEGLKFSGVVAPQLGFTRGKTFSQQVKFYAKEDPSQLIRTVGTTNSLNENNGYSQTINAQVLANYTKKFNYNHKLTTLLGYESNTFRNESGTAYRDGYILTDYQVIDAGSITNWSNGGNADENALRSYFGRADYSYKGRYLLGVSGRFDGSSRFASEHRWGFFPAVSGAWVVSEEAFAKSLPVNFLKLRASWGQNGNQQIGNYGYLSSLNLGTTLFNNTGNTTVSVPNGYLTVASIYDKTWETKEDYNIGLDFTILKNRLTVNADYFVKNTRDILLNLPIPLVVGLTSAEQNAARLRNKGWDLLASWNDRIGSDWSYTVSANISDYTNKVIDLKGTSTIGDQAILEGQPINVYYGYRSAGYFKDAADVAASPKLTNAEKPGDLKFVDINGDGKIDAANDRVALGNSLPRYTYGGFANVKYKNLDLSFSFQGIAKQLRRPDRFMIDPTVSNGSFNIQQYINGNTWTPENPNSKYPRLTSTNATLNYQTNTDFYLFNGAYFRIKDINLGYTINPKALNYIGVKNARIFVSATDLFSIQSKDFQKGWDPEDNQSAGPIISTFLAGLSITF